MFAFIRAVIYSTLFVGFLLVFVPGRILAGAGIARPPELDGFGLLGVLAATMGALVALSCILTFVFVGRGTPAPFDPPRRLVVRGPYRWVRNPMYLGAGLALAGAAVVYRSAALLGYLVVLALITQALVVWYEEPTLGRLFGTDYAAYKGRVHRWLPWPARLGGRTGSATGA